MFEQNGELIIVLTGEENPKYPIITDGIIQSSVLEDVDKTEEWLLKELQKAGYNSASEIFLAEYESGQIKLVPYNQDNKKELKMFSISSSYDKYSTRKTASDFETWRPQWVENANQLSNIAISFVGSAPCFPYFEIVGHTLN